jgi:hypothetical protein
MKAADLFREFQDAQHVAGQFAFFTILFFVPQIGGANHVIDSLDGTIQMDLLNAAEEKNWQPLAILGVPSLEGLRMDKRLTLNDTETTTGPPATSNPHYVIAFR